MNNRTLRTKPLRVGNTYLEITGGAFGSFCVNAVNTEVDLKEDHAVFRTTLKPAGSNQKDDADDLFKKDPSLLSELKFTDQKIWKEARDFFGAYNKRLKPELLQLEIIYDKSYLFSISLIPINPNDIVLKVIKDE